MFFWVGFPFVRYVLCLIGGIILSFYTGWSQGVLLIPLGLSFFLFTFLFHRFPFTWIRIVTGLLFMGFLMVLGSHIWERSHAVVPELNDAEAYIARIKHVDKTDSIHSSYRIQLLMIRIKGCWEERSGIVQIKVEGFSDYLPGDLLLIPGAPYRLQSRINPGDFDYASYMASKGIFHMQKIQSQEIQLLEKGRGMVRWTTLLRNQGLNIIRKRVKDKDGKAILEALVLGYKKDLAPETREIWSGTGSMHVLAVSGLHVGMIYLLLNFILSPFRRLPGGRYWIVALSLISLAAYAMLTGISSSVLRASLMFGLMIFSQNFRQQANIYNSIAVSAFILILFDPGVIFQLGFQLSYAAVLGIIILYPYFQSLFECRFWLINKVGSLTAVSLAAQLGTLPLLIFSFHQVPSYGLLSNLLLIPSAFVLLLGSLTGLAFSNLAGFPVWIFSFLELYLSMLNEILKFLYHLPFSTRQFMHWSLSHVLICYGFIISIAGLLLRRRVFFLCLLALVLIFYCILEIPKRTPDHILIYRKKQGLQMDLLSRNHSLSFYRGTPDIELSKKSSLKFGTSVPQDQSMASPLSFWQFQGKEILIITDPEPDYEKLCMSVDYLILSGRAKFRWEEIAEKVHSQTIIVNGWEAKEMAKVHFIQRHGAFHKPLGKQENYLD